MFNFKNYKGIDSLIRQIPEEGLEGVTITSTLGFRIAMLMPEEADRILSSGKLERHDFIGLLAAIGHNSDFQSLAALCEIDPDELDITESDIGRMTSWMEKWGLDAANPEEFVMIERLTRFDKALRHPEFGFKFQAQLDPSLKAKFDISANFSSELFSTYSYDELLDMDDEQLKNVQEEIRTSLSSVFGEHADLAYQSVETYDFHEISMKRNYALQAFTDPDFQELSKKEEIKKLVDGLHLSDPTKANPQTIQVDAQPESESTIGEDIKLVFTGILNIAARFLEELPPSPLKKFLEYDGETSLFDRETPKTISFQPASEQIKEESNNAGNNFDTPGPKL